MISFDQEVVKTFPSNEVRLIFFIVQQLFRNYSRLAVNQLRCGSFFRKATAQTMSVLRVTVFDTKLIKDLIGYT